MSEPKKIAVYIEVGTSKRYPDECGKNCPFLNLTHCLLFNEDLEETQLLEGHEWQDESSITMQRCFRCTCMEEL